MDISAISQVVATLGFPICMCVALFWYINKQTEIHREESNKTVDAINKLEVKITELVTRMVTKEGVTNDE